MNSSFAFIAPVASASVFAQDPAGTYISVTESEYSMDLMLNEDGTSRYQEFGGKGCSPGLKPLSVADLPENDSLRRLVFWEEKACRPADHGLCDSYR